MVSFGYTTLLPNSNRAFALRSTTPYPTGVVGLDYVRRRP
jgi:hypothetical protein